jgi:hypothetical protein
MSKSDCFNTGFFVMEQPHEDVFLSVSPGFEWGPGIERDGLTQPRMLDPHSLAHICELANCDPIEPRLTTDGFEQRAGTWTVYHHLKRFIAARGDRWQVIGIQSNGDLTMNPWHVAFIGDSHIARQKHVLCRLATGDQEEPIESRVYRCFVKWNERATRACGRRYDFLDLDIRVEPPGNRYTLRLHDPDERNRNERWLKRRRRKHSEDITELVEFALAGKQVVERGVDLAMSNAIDRFQDIRHVFDVPSVPAHGSYQMVDVRSLYFGEYQLFKYPNERRAALFAPVVINLTIEKSVEVTWSELKTQLLKEHFRLTHESPTRPGQFRRVSDAPGLNQVEIFFPQNVYPFGALGLQHGDAGDSADERRAAANAEKLICLSAGGLSGRVGNTLTGVTRIMYDFFGCSDAIILDEGLDVFSVVNPVVRAGKPAANGIAYRYDNDEFRRRVLTVTKKLVDTEHGDTLAQQRFHRGGLKAWPLNREIMQELEEDARQPGMADDDGGVSLVRPQRSQIRSTLIYAVRKAPADSSAQAPSG